MTVGNATISLPPRPSWVRGACAALLLTVLYITATETLGTLPALVLPSEYHLLRGVVASVGMGVVAALTLVVGFEVLLANRRRDLRPYGIARPTRVWSSIGIALAAYFPIVIVGFALSSALGLGGTTTPDVGHQSNGAKVAISFLVIVVAPWLEEVSIRGMLFSSLAGRFGFWLGAGLSGFLWASAHLVGGVLIPFTMLGMLLAFVRWRTGSVLPGMILHGTQNSLAAAVGAGVGWYMAPMPFVLAATIGLTWRWLPRDGAAG